jgi:hypothetical protein
MAFETETAESGGERRSVPTIRAARRGKRLAQKNEPTVAASAERVRQMLASLRAEQAQSHTTPGDRVRTIEWLRRFLAVREQERAAWASSVGELQARLAEAQRCAQAAEAALDQAAVQHRRTIADLKLLHEHQRSIWELERRRLEISAAGAERPRRRPMPVVSPLNKVASLCLIAATAIALSSDSGSSFRGPRPHLDDAARAAVVLARHS